MAAFKLLLVASVVSCVLSQAPGDGDSLCVDPLVDNGNVLVPNPFFALRPTYPANVRPLMDSRDYLNLLQREGAVWQQVDNDTSNVDFSSTDVSHRLVLCPTDLCMRTCTSHSGVYFTERNGTKQIGKVQSNEQADCA